VSDESIYAICRCAARQGRPLSLHAITFGFKGYSESFASLRRMAQIAWEVQIDEANDPQHPAAVTIPSSYTVTLDTARLTETLLGISESLR